MNNDKHIKDLNYIIDGLFEELRQCKMGDNVGVDNYDYWVNEFEELLLAQKKQIKKGA